MDWQTMDTAPRDGTAIVAICDHDADTYTKDSGGKRLTTYGAHCEGTTHRKGRHVCIAVWGGGFTDFEMERNYTIPNWWFDANSDFEMPVNPVLWKPLDLTCLIDVVIKPGVL